MYLSGLPCFMNRSYGTASMATVTNNIYIQDDQMKEDSLQEMPISSGAQGHIGFGVDTSIRWFPKGGKTLYMPFKVNSYLQRYLYCDSEAKSRLFNKHSKNLHYPVIQSWPSRKKSFSKETFKSDEKTIWKNQQERIASQNGNVSATNTVLASKRTIKKTPKQKTDATKSSFCTLL